MSVESKFDASKFDAKATPEKETRAVFGKRLGEIIESVIGDGRIKELFEQAGKHPDEYEGKPTGLVAMDLGVISAETKTALLVAQAAERTFTLAEKAEATAAMREEALNSRKKVPDDGYTRHTDEVFKYVGSARDPQILQQAQGTWMAAQMLFNNEVEAINGRIEHIGMVGGSVSVGVEAADGFKAAAAALYGKAGEMLAKEGHKDAAEKLDAVSKALAKDVKGGGPAPDKVMEKIAERYRQGGEEMYQVLSDPRYLQRDPIEDVFDKLAKLTAQDTQPQRPAAKAKPPAAVR